MDDPVAAQDPRQRAARALEAGRTAEALMAIEQALQADPDDGELLQVSGALLNGEGRFAEARERLARAGRSRGGLASFWTSCAIALQGCGERIEAESAFRRAAELDPGDPALLLNLAQFLADAGRIADTAPILERVLQLRPGHAAAVSGLLATGLYDPSRAPEELARTHRAWAASLEAQVAPVPLPPWDWNPGRPLTVAYLSADFRTHSCAAFLEPLLTHHDRARHRILLAANAAGGDPRTGRFQALADGWIEAWSLDDPALLARLRDERVDVLVDLGGHTAFNRVPLLARRPAPVQLEWLGYPFPTGFTRLEGRVTDSQVDPPGSESATGEVLQRLDPCYLCWQPPEQGPVPAASREGPFTFGSFNHFAKLNDAVLQTWAAILRRAPGSRLLLKGKGSQDPVLRERLLSAFEQEGVPRRRILLEGWKEAAASHLAQYHQVDLALDPFPYNGVTTSVEALWMGVPVLALNGVHSLSRHGQMLLAQVGLEELAAATPDAYIATAVRIATDPGRLAQLRCGLRGRLLASPLCDATGFAQRMEALYRRLWRDACEAHSPGA